MELIAAVLLAAALLLAPNPAQAQSPDLGSEINRQVRAAKSASSEMGVHVVALDEAEEVYAYRADAMRILASNTKLMTSAAALDHLGPGFFFETPVMVRGEVVDGVLKGDLGVIGGGDPNISGRHHNGESFAPFREWAEALRRFGGIRRISGEIVLATGLFDDQLVHPTWPKDQLDRWYEAPVAALSFNDNCALVKVEPVGGAGGGPRLSLLPEVPFMRLSGSVTRTARSRDQRLRIGRNALAADAATRRTIEVSGRLWRGRTQVDTFISVDDPVAYFGAALRQALAESGIEVEGRVVTEKRLVGAAWRPVTVHRSDLLTTLEVVNKRSQNFFAESVLKLLGARYCGRGTWPAGASVVSDFLRGIGLDDAAFEVADGSGMSRDNRATPRQITSLLRHMFYHRWGGEFVRTLPFSGEADLRWEKRLAEGPYRGNVLAKTGSLRGVSTLSGYAK
ncbi:MAG: D-alanyl-D-alanine carboxypeptidase/D-alanyl-D-alanine-endopeptidase, partial [Acidobacteriota bacterium]